MKKLTFRAVSAVLAAVMLLSCMALGASALTYDHVDAELAGWRDPYYSPTSSYSSDYYYNQLTAVPLTGDGRRDTIAVALSQVGYLEGDSYDRSGTTGGDGNYTEYGYYMDCDGYAWCASFCSFVYYNARVTDLYGYNNSCGNNMYDYGYWWSDTYVPNWSNQLNYYGMYKYGHYYGGSYIPQPGDTIFFTYYETPLDEDHIGIVVYCDGETVYTIEGNTSSQDGLVSEGGGVFFKKYDIDSYLIAGYGAMPFDTVDDLPDIDYSGENPTPGVYVAVPEIGTKTLYADFDCTSVVEYVPYGTMFEVLSVEVDSVGDTLLYSKVVVDGVTQYGYIIHGSDSYRSTAKTLQIYVNDSTPQLSSEKYSITTDNKIKGVSVNSTVEAMLGNLSDDGTDITYAVYNGATKVSANESLATGMTVRLIKNGTTVNSYSVIVKGDINGDGMVTGVDYLRAKRHVLGSVTLSGDAAEAAMITGDRIAAADYTTIKRYVLGTYKFD